MRSRKKRSNEELRLEEYPFYPFILTEAGPIEFDAVAFRAAVEHLLSHDNPRAAGELIVIGEQNLVRDTFGSRELARYKEAVMPYQQAVMLAPKDAGLRYDLGACYAKLGNLAAAKKQHEVLVTLDKARADLLLFILDP